jgi:hypothetical protein
MLRVSLCEVALVKAFSKLQLIIVDENKQFLGSAYRTYWSLLRVCLTFCLFRNSPAQLQLPALSNSNNLAYNALVKSSCKCVQFYVLCFCDIASRSKMKNQCLTGKSMVSHKYFTKAAQKAARQCRLTGELDFME